MAAPSSSPGQRVNVFNRTGNVIYDNPAVGDNNPGVFVLFLDGQYAEVPRAQITQISGSWLSGIGPGQ